MRDRAREDAEQTAVCVTELETALAHQVATHNSVIDALTAERDGLCTLVE